MFNLLGLLSPFPKEGRKKIEMKDIEEVIDQLAYKYSIPQGIIRNIVWTWMQFEKKRLYND